MSIIQFPGDGSRPPNKKGSKQPRVEQVKCPHDRIHLGPITYTCPHCTTKATLSGENLIFRTLEFYCGGCGVLHRMTNPAFGEPDRPGKPPKK